MKRITAVEELTDAVVSGAISSLLKQARTDVANRKAKLVLGAGFRASEDELLDGPMGLKMRAIFAHVRGQGERDAQKVAELCEEVLEFLWSSMFAGHYQIPDTFWDTPLGFAIYEVIGRLSDVPDGKELTSIQAAKYLGISQPYLHRLSQQGTVPIHRRVGTHSRYRVGDLKEARRRLDRLG